MNSLCAVTAARLNILEEVNLVTINYSRTPRIRPPSESHWCGRMRGMVAREGFRYAALLQHRHTKYGRIRGMVVGEGGRSTGVLL